MNNFFFNNSAFQQGGALYYDLFSPDGLLSNTFELNSASYGDNYASYPFKLGLISSP